MNAGSIKKNQIGVKLVTQECPWQHYLPLDGATVGFSASNRRRFYRHKISLPLELRDQRVNAPLRINATDVSANGCYVESMQPLPLGTVLQVDLWLDSETHQGHGCGPHVRSWRGQWNRVHRDAADTKQRMQSYLEAIDPQMESPRLRIQTRSSVLGTLIFD